MDYLEYYRQMADWRERVLDAVKALPEGSADRRPAAGRHSPRGLLNHILQSETYWIDGVVAGGSPAEDDIGLTLDELDEAFASRRRGTETLLRSLNGESLGREICAPWDPGVRFTLDRALVHFITHEAHHRGQLCLLIRQLGGEPPSVDLL